jgi:hypothetical protein
MLDKNNIMDMKNNMGANSDLDHCFNITGIRAKISWSKYILNKEQTTIYIFTTLKQNMSRKLRGYVRR